LDEVFEMLYEKVIARVDFYPSGYFVPVGKKGKYKVVLSTDDGVFGGYDRVDKDYEYVSYKTPADWNGFNCYIPSRCGIVLEKVKKVK
jgi:1,4-alpha-glucan branching enzyme